MMSRRMSAPSAVHFAFAVVDAVTAEAMTDVQDLSMTRPAELASLSRPLLTGSILRRLIDSSVTMESLPHFATRAVPAGPSPIDGDGPDRQVVGVDEAVDPLVALVVARFQIGFQGEFVVTVAFDEPDTCFLQRNAG